MSEHRRHHHRHHGGTSSNSLDRDTRRREFQSAALIMPAILFAIGLAVWGWGMNYHGANAGIHNDNLVECGAWIMGICGGIFLLLLLVDWSRRLSRSMKDARLHRAAERERHHGHHHRHHHHGDESDGVPAPDDSPAAPDDGKPLSV